MSTKKEETKKKETKKDEAKKIEDIKVNKAENLSEEKEETKTELKNDDAMLSYKEKYYKKAAELRLLQAEFKKYKVTVQQGISKLQELIKK